MSKAKKVKTAKPKGEQIDPLAGTKAGAAAAAAEPRPATVNVTDPVSGKTTEVSTTPPDLKDYKGSYTHASYPDKFGLKVMEDDPHGKTHHLKSVDHFWSGTEDEFKQQFEK